MDRYRKQEWNNVYKRKWPVILAMQGDPYTGKTKLAKHLAGWLNYPILRLEDFVDTLSPNCPQNPETIFSQAFDLLTRVVKTHTSTGFSVIVDSPLSRLSHFDKLVSLLNVDSLDKGSINLSLLVIECKPSIPYTSEMKFMERDPKTSNKWYKPQKWPPDPRFTGRDYTDDSMHPMVSKLVVDTCKNFQIGDMLAAVHDLTAGPEGYRVELHKWKYTRGYNPHLIRQRNTSLSSDQNKELVICVDTQFPSTMKKG